MSDFEKIFNNYKSDDTPVEINKYVTMMKEMNPYMTPFQNNTTNRENQEISINQYLNKDYIYNTNVNDNFEALIDNLSDFYSSVLNSNLIKSKRFVIGKYNLGVNKLDTVSYVGNKTKTQLVNLTKPDSMNIKSIIMLPKDAVVFSCIQLPGTNIMKRANLNNTFLNYWQLLNRNTYIENQFVDNESLKADKRNSDLYDQDQPQPQPQIQSQPHSPEEKQHNFLKKPMNYILDIYIENFINDNKEQLNAENDEIESTFESNTNLINMQNKINNISFYYSF
jgi:hypothetical protein